VTPAEGDWPWWRGPARNNHAVGPSPPTKWSDTENVIWKVDIPGRGHATPILWGERVFIATADDIDETQSLLCLSRADGSLLWNKQIHHGEFISSHDKGSHASCTPACDGERVICVFAIDDAVWASALDLAGNLQWQEKVGPFLSKHGYGTSPVIYKSLVIMAVDHDGEGYVSALDRATGEVVWRTKRLREASFATPNIAHVAGRDQLLLSGQDRVVSYDPATGEEIWTCAGSANSTANTMAASGDHVFASGGWHQTGVIAIRADGSGDVSGSHVAWTDTAKMYVPSPVVAGELLIGVRDEGIVVGYEIASGDKLWAKRLRSNIGVSASPVLLDDLAYLPNEAGEVFVFRAAREFELIAINPMNEEIYASPVIAGGRIYLRTLTKLYCIGE
jgi:outer membrane protein assembly factor BamB